jgi:outer membrane protein assembly factor BamB
MKVQTFVRTFPSKTVLTVFLLLVVLFGAQAGGEGEEGEAWPCWRGPNRDGVSLETDWDPLALDGGVRITWVGDAGRGFSNIAIQGELVVTMGAFDTIDHVVCLNAVSGEEIWRYSTETFSIYGPQSTPTVDGDRIYAQATDGNLICLDMKNGELLWSKQLREDFDLREPRYGFSASPVVDGKLLIVNASSRMICLNKRNGDLVWSIESEVPRKSWGSYSTIVVSEIGGKRCALFVGPGSFHAVEVATGRELWSYDHGDELHPVADPIVRENEVFLSLSESCVILQMTGDAASKVWSSTEFNTAMSPPIRVNGHVYGTHWPVEYWINSYDWNRVHQLDWPFRCVNWETGEVMWEQKMKPVSLMAAGDMLIVLELDGTLRIVEASPSSYRERSRTDVLNGRETKRLFVTPPVLLDGKIYCRNYSGELICIDVSE